jgi:DNA-binding winged helix-turn-helix (wHTH) protein
MIDTVAFAECELSLGRRELRRAGALVAIEPQVFDVLAYLVVHRDRVVSKHELLDEIWGTRFVSESALTSRIKSARRAVGDTGRDQRIIRTVHGHGYRLVADVAEDMDDAPDRRTAAMEPLDQLLETVFRDADPVTRRRVRAAARAIVAAAADAAAAAVVQAHAAMEGVEGVA